MNSGMGNMPNAPMSGMPTPKSKAPAIILSVIVGAIIIAGVVYAISSKSDEKVTIATVTPTLSPNVTSSVSPSVSPSPEITTTPTTVAQSKVYSNQYLSVTIPGGWSYSATQSGAVNITKNDYILYINPRAQQASGVQGGRLGEIAAGAPSYDIVVGGNGVCITDPVKIAATGGFSRYDYYINPADQSGCEAHPSNGSTIWYFSYLSQDGGFFNHTAQQQGTAEGYVITMAYNEVYVNNLPVKGSATLNAMLKEMTSIAATLKLKPVVATKTYTDSLQHITLQYPSTWTIQANAHAPGDINLQPSDKFVADAKSKNISVAISGHCMNTQCLTVYTLDDMVREYGATKISNASAKNVTGYKVKFAASGYAAGRTGYMFIKGPDLVVLTTDIYSSELENIIPTLELLTTKGVNDRFGE